MFIRYFLSLSVCYLVPDRYVQWVYESSVAGNKADNSHETEPKQSIWGPEKENKKLKD